jgi:hypothetical protein
MHGVPVLARPTIACRGEHRNHREEEARYEPPARRGQMLGRALVHTGPRRPARIPPAHIAYRSILQPVSPDEDRTHCRSDDDQGDDGHGSRAAATPAATPAEDGHSDDHGDDRDYERHEWKGGVYRVGVEAPVPAEPMTEGPFEMFIRPRLSQGECHRRAHSAGGSHQPPVEPRGRPLEVQLMTSQRSSPPTGPPRCARPCIASDQERFVALGLPVKQLPIAVHLYVFGSTPTGQPRDPPEVRRPVIIAMVEKPRVERPPATLP